MRRNAILARARAAIGALVLLTSMGSAARAEGPEDEGAFPIAEQAALFSPTWSRAAPRVSPVQVWATGVTRAAPSFVPTSARSVGLRLPPAPITGVAFGGELHRADEPAAASQSELTWSYGRKGRDFGLDALSWAVRAQGRVGVLTPGLSQNIATSLSVSLPKLLPASTARLQVSPEMSYDAVPKVLTVGGGPELASETVLPSPSTSLKSALNVSVGYRFSSDSKPGVAASVAWTLTPAL